MNVITISETTPSPEGIVTKPSKFSVEETLARLQEAIRAHNLTLFAHIDHSGEAERVELAMQPAHVLIFGNPKGGTPLMIAAPLLALDLPLKVLTWQDKENQVWVSSNSVSFLKQRYGLPQELARSLAVIDVVIEQALNG